MLIKWSLPVLITLMLCGCFNNTNDTVVEPEALDQKVTQGVNDVFNLMGVMEKALPANTVYKASVAFETIYPAQHYEVHLLNNHTNQFRQIESGELQKNKKIDFTFEERFDHENLTLIFRLSKAGLPFLIGQPGEYICYLDIPRPFFSRQLTCNESTTAMVLMAHNDAINNFTDLLSAETINQWKKLDNIDQSITLDMFALVVSAFQTTLIELPMNIPYEERDKSQLAKYADITNSMMAYISENHYLDIRFLENQISYHYPEMEKLGFILSTNGASWVNNWHDYFLTSEKRRRLLNQFFRASSDLVFVDTQAFRVQQPQWNEKSKTISWVNWPWFESVEIFVDEVSIGLVHGNAIELESEVFDTISFKPLGKLGQFQTIKIRKSALTERFERQFVRHLSGE